MGNKPVSLVYNKGSNRSAILCLPGSLKPKLVRGKVVICDRGVNARVAKGVVVRDAGGVGMILANTAESREELVADSHLLPAVAVGREVGDKIREFAKSANPTLLPTLGGPALNARTSAVVAAFCPRGPNTVTPHLIGPRVNILAAWSEATGPTVSEMDKRRTQLNIISGISYNCLKANFLLVMDKTRQEYDFQRLN